jgi:hypothetical protein
VENAVPSPVFFQFVMLFKFLTRSGSPVPSAIAVGYRSIRALVPDLIQERVAGAPLLFQHFRLTACYWPLKLLVVGVLRCDDELLASDLRGNFSRCFLHHFFGRIFFPSRI